MSPIDPPSNTGLLVCGLGKSYRKKTVLRDVSMELHQGEAVALLGPNGAGKTTCFYAIAGLVIADKGKVYIDGLDATHLPMYRRAKIGISYLPQEASIFRGLSAERNIFAVAELFAPSRRKAKQQTDQLLEEFAISHIRTSLAVTLSGGERRRVEIARCLASNPKYILLDEPFAGVDPIAVADIRSLVAQLKERNVGVLITDHNVREALEIVDRAYILHDGYVLMDGTAQEVVQHPDVRRVYLGENYKA